MDIVITQQEYQFLEQKLFAAYILPTRAPPLPAREFSELEIEDGRTGLQIGYVRDFEDRVATSVELRAWFQRQRSKAFTYDETVLQCSVALECEANYDLRCKRYWWVVLCAEAYRMGLRNPSYATFLKRVRELPSGPRIPVGEAF
ncbi:hypothetical protein [Rhizobium phaseoli]|uniref:hypothetical protein n=1 Tax=Rhizobium phaseoli TaxID=396 RepID=UPI0007EAE217|nr:hypothetical protein [Rhizobium phaseoli]ANL33896.1 hypothetical protein AMC89_CH01823 [Rhizobium phaseoli]ANL97621.1 hypothetical protein AMC79_CH01818 [Rhizobium phaseoli]